MKICAGAFEAEVVLGGTVFQCCVMRPEYKAIGNLLHNDLAEIWNGKKNRYILECLSRGDYSVCSSECLFVKHGNFEDVPFVEVDEIPTFPTKIGLCYEDTCNYDCTFCRHHSNSYSPKMTALYDTIEKKLEPYMPQCKYVHTNGCGEIFVSKHTLDFLSRWHPLAPKEEITVEIISNGSLFDENHWKRIEHLGQYNLKVQISVMSFDEHVYQTLSGVKLPISKIEHNLHFIQKLRAEGLVNHFMVSSVVQDRNFRTMPEFTRRLIEEFNVDEVHLRGILWVNRNNFNSWITDVRNEYHPYHQEYLEVMKNPIFKHPKVSRTAESILKDSKIGDMPQNIILKNETNIKNLEEHILSQMVLNESVFDEMAHFIKIWGGKAIIYGATPLGITMALKLSEKCNVKYILDLKTRGTVGKIQVLGIDELPPPSRTAPIIFADFHEPPNLVNYLRSVGYNGSFVGVNKFFQL